MKRWLDGRYFSNIRHNRDEKVCFSDMTLAEQRLVLKYATDAEKDELCIHLARMLHAIGDKFDISGSEL